MLLLSWVKQVLKTGAMIAWDYSCYIPIPPLPPSNLSHPTCKSVLSVCQTYSFQNSPQMQKKSQFCKNWVRGVKDKEEKVLETSLVLWMQFWSRTHLGGKKPSGWFEERGRDSTSTEMGCTLPTRLFGLTAKVKATELFNRMYMQ